MQGLSRGLGLLSVLFAGAIFGFFYAWVCSTMWGLDTADPNTAIAAMQAMNASVRNVVFAPAFFATPFVLGLTALVAWGASRRAALAFGAGAVLYLVGGLLLTVTVNVPMNEALALVELPLDPEVARATWDAYSHPWQTWNLVRTVASGASLALAALGLMLLGPGAGQKPA